ncbi:MAG TPA: hypothetical protein H9764_09635, partial [Candidatus Flavonifractor merdavium]|nr:hypothetical protein [Candidatus Flavonifractor merdavium]
FIPAGEAFSPACFVMPFFSRAIFAGLFLFQLLTFVCRTPYLCPPLFLRFATKNLAGHLMRYII